MTRPCDLVGTRFNDLTVLDRNHTNTKAGKARWICRCICGNVTLASTNQLKTGRKKSCGCRKALPFGEGSFNMLFSSYARGAKRRKLKFLLDKETFRALTKGYCYFCGKTPESNYQSNGCRGSYVYNGIDRLDNKKGYTAENCVSCCTYCNRAKNNRTKEEFINWILRVYNKVVMKSEFYKFQKGSGSI